MKKELIKRIISSIILIPITLFFIIKGSLLFNVFIIICFFIALYEWHMMSKNKPYNLPGFIFLTFSFFAIYELRINETEDYLFFLYITVICVSTDIGGFIFGKFFKGPKLTKLSPNKTYAGMIGGYALSFIFIIFFRNYTSENEHLNDMSFFTIFLISTVSQLGDIVISYFKRLSNVKDTGKIIPGHGGLLDRIDGMIFAYSFIYISILMDFF